jgi:hypothetical protein
MVTIRLATAVGTLVVAPEDVPRVVADAIPDMGFEVGDGHRCRGERTDVVAKKLTGRATAVRNKHGQSKEATCEISGDRTAIGNREADERANSGQRDDIPMRIDEMRRWRSQFVDRGFRAADTKRHRGE